MRLAFARAMTLIRRRSQPSLSSLTRFAAARLDLAAALRIEIVSPPARLHDYHSLLPPHRRPRAGDSVRLLDRACSAPADRANCNADPAKQPLGPDLADANLLKLRASPGRRR